MRGRSFRIGTVVVHPTAVPLPALDDFHVATCVDPARFAAQLAAAAMNIDGLISTTADPHSEALRSVVDEQRGIAREVSAISAGQQVELLRRVRHIELAVYPG